ncbi:hypothetical protein CBER1_11971 [Cercospora berteroae]|uniref:Tat pathway signal sequence n=1 Tax=Cercospora berteroae TaxID=357750 RepID=A0A2S6CKB8_9PEZI|nr:hypothetical protein CBER1_11971 [Cercospora berteroae]
MTKTAPLSTKIDLRYNTRKIYLETLANKSDPDYIYRKSNDEEVAKAWERLSSPAVFPISRSDVIRSGKDPRYAVQAPEHFGWPPDSFIGSLQSIHNLHCLDTLRQNLVTNYHYYWGFRFGFSPNIVWEYHLYHCLDMLRQQLMCNADLSVFTYNWRASQSGIFADFTTSEKCVNFDDLLEFNDEWKERMKHKFTRWSSVPRPDPNPFELPPPPDAPLITEKTKWAWINDSSGGWVPVEPIRGFEDREYCLGNIDGSAIEGTGPDSS